MVRNPIDNIFSYQNVSFDSNNTNVLAHRWAFYYNQINKYLSLHSEKFLVVKYENLITYTEHELEKIAQLIPINRLATTEEMASVVVFLSSNLNTYLTGQNITVDGGYTNI